MQREQQIAKILGKLDHRAGHLMNLHGICSRR
jgi:hypothetical protein